MNRRNLKASLALLIVGTGLVALYPGQDSASAVSPVPPPRIVVEFLSQADGELRDIDGTMMMCFDGVYVDLATNVVVGTGSDCLDLNSSSVKWNKWDKDTIERVRRLLLDESRIDPARELFRAKAFWDVIFVSRPLAQAIDDMGFSGVRWIELSDYPEL